MKPDAFNHWLQRAQAQAELCLERVLPAADTAPQRLHQAMRYVSLGGGKRVRPLLVFAAAQLGQAHAAMLAQAVAAVELIHVYSLVHDDMPEMDNDSLRRGKPTCHVQYDQATALLAGDALQTLAFDVLSREVGWDAARQLRMLHTLAQASGSLGMAGGQAIDLANVGQALDQTALQQMHSLKTGALIRAAVALGGLCCADVSDAGLRQLDVYAVKLGLAFQVIDDVLDCEQDTATLGKTAGKDAQNDKPTYVGFMGLAAARAYAEQLVAEARQALDGLDERADALRALADFVVARRH